MLNNFNYKFNITRNTLHDWRRNEDINVTPSIFQEVEYATGKPSGQIWIRFRFTLRSGYGAVEGRGYFQNLFVLCNTPIVAIIAVICYEKRGFRDNLKSREINAV